MRILKITSTTLILLAALIVTGCTHKLVAHGGETTVSVFHSKNDFDKLQSMKSEGGAAGMIGGLGENLVSTKVPENTKVQVLSSQGDATQIEIIEGPKKGLQGFVAKDNVE